ncbi:heme-dependent oxidative N-demethylase family protein [Novosphingobium sp. 9]|uniref:heme-dependent oxidative N-demethylase family protein n=1 Tax=Novosphingobium sp. 9 TaxID=2025349 RepID=UPI0021B663AC|nr:DUF3445 domain-containing protein [Novosphingobium sp. 9]
MSLGFSVETLLPYARVTGAPRMGLVRLGESDWLDAAPDLAARAEVFEAHTECVMALPEAGAAIAELSDVLRVQGGLEACGRAHWEDFCLLVQDRRGEPYRLVAGALAFPTDWHLPEKLGLPMGAVHAPIHGYAGQLERGVDRFMDGLKEGQIFGRANVFVQPSPALRYLPGALAGAGYSHITPDNAGETLWIRSERQSLRRLPESGAIVFAIGIYRTRLDALSDAAVERLALSLTGFGAGELDRRAGPLYAQGLAAYADARKRRSGAQD